LTKRVTVIAARREAGRPRCCVRGLTLRSTLVASRSCPSTRDPTECEAVLVAVIDALRHHGALDRSENKPVRTTALDGDQMVDRVLSEIAQRVEPSC